jgi:hypothetical protein
MRAAHVPLTACRSRRHSEVSLGCRVRDECSETRSSVKMAGNVLIDNRRTARSGATQNMASGKGSCRFGSSS